MREKQAIRAMLRASGRSMQSVSLGMGRNRKFVSQVLGQDSDTVRIDTLAGIADQCGYDMVIERGDDGITVDPR